MPLTMHRFLKYLGWICLGGIAMTFTFCSVGVYQVMQTVSQTLADADNYTCRQFLYDIDVSRPETNKFPALMAAYVAYGMRDDGTPESSRQNAMMDDGMEPAVRKVYALCKNNPSERVFNLFTASITGATTVPTIQNNVSATAPASSTLNTKP